MPTLAAGRNAALGAAGGRLRRRNGSYQNNFPWPCVVQLFARFLLDRGRIGLEGFDLVHVLTVFFLQAVDFFPQGLQLGAFLAIDHHAVGAEHGVQEYSNYKKDGSGGSQTTPLQSQPRPRRARAFNPTRRRGFGLWALMPGLTKGVPHGLIHSATHRLTHRLTQGGASAWKDKYPRCCAHSGCTRPVFS